MFSSQSAKDCPQLARSQESGTGHVLSHTAPPTAGSLSLPPSLCKQNSGVFKGHHSLLSFLVVSPESKYIPWVHEDAGLRTISMKPVSQCVQGLWTLKGFPILLWPYWVIHIKSTWKHTLVICICFYKDNPHPFGYHLVLSVLKEFFIWLWWLHWRLPGGNCHELPVILLTYRPCMQSYQPSRQDRTSDEIGTSPLRAFWVTWDLLCR